MTFKKIIAWTLLFLGIIIILTTLLKTFHYFQGNEPFPQVFFEEVTPASPKAENFLNDMVQEQLSSFISKESILNLLNITVYSLFAFILIFGGAKISEIGIKLLKE